jgi:hypothetical protein
MPLARINGTILHFIHVPKTGGSSVKDYLMSKGAVALFHRTPIDWCATTPQHMEAGVHSALVPDGFADQTFMMLRDPVARLVSEYRYRAKRYAEEAGWACPGPGPEHWLHFEQEGAFRGTFDAFVSFAFGKTRKNPRFADNHIRPQSDFWRPGTRVFRYEDGIEPILRWIDTVTETAPVAGRHHSNQSPILECPIPSTMFGEIKAFYDADYDLMRQAAGVEPAQP